MKRISKPLLALALILFSSSSFAKKIIVLEKNDANCNKVDGTSQNYLNAVASTLDLMTRDIEFIKPEPYPICSYEIATPKGRYICNISDILSSDNGKTAYAGNSIGAEYCFKKP